MTRLIPVNQWVWWLWKVTYHKTEDGPALLTKYLVATDTHVEGEICEWGTWPGDGYNHAKWEQVGDDPVPASNVQIGSLYGRAIYEDGWTYGKRLAEKRGLK